MKNVKFISYTGKWPCLCSGDLCMEIAGKTYTFGFMESWWESGGSCWYANGEVGHDEGSWRLNERRLPEALRPYAAEMLAEFNATEHGISFQSQRHNSSSTDARMISPQGEL